MPTPNEKPEKHTRSQRFEGIIPTAYLDWDAYNSQLRAFGPVRNDFNGLGRRFNLTWTAGRRGKPALNADILSATEATREIADPEFEILGTNCVSTCSAIYAEGGISLITTTGSADQVILKPHVDASQTAWSAVTWGTDKSTVWEAHIATAAAITSEIVWAKLGITDVPTTATDDDQIMIRYEAGVSSGKWVVTSSIAGTDTATVTDFVVAVSTQYHFKVEIDADRVARVWINDTLVHTSGALTTATDLIPFIGVQTSTTAAKTIYVFGQAISRVIG